MKAALEEAEKAYKEGEVPVGAVIVLNDEIIGSGYNKTLTSTNATYHAEMIAINQACHTLNSRLLEGADIYVTLEPCLMCAGAILLSRIRKIYYAAFEPKFGACGSVYNIPEQNLYNHSPEVFSGIYEEKSRFLLQKYFVDIRNNKLY